MSLANLSLYANATCDTNNANYAFGSIVDDAIHTAFYTKNSYFQGMIGCICVVVAVGYFGTMAAIDLLSSRDQAHYKEISILKGLLQQQTLKIESIEKELELQKQNANILGNAVSHINNETDRMLKSHIRKITDHSNLIMDCRNDINTQHTMLNNHNESLMNVIRHLYEQNNIINHTHAVVENHKILIQGQMDTLDCLNEDLEHAVTEFDRLAEYIDQSVIELEIKFEDAIHHFQSANDKFADQLEEHENQLYSVEDELFERLKDMGDRVEEVDRAVVALEKSTEKLELDYQALTEKVEQIENDTENELIMIGKTTNMTPIIISNKVYEHFNGCNLGFRNNGYDTLYLDQLLRLTKIKSVELCDLIKERHIYMNDKPISSFRKVCVASCAFCKDILKEDKDLNTLVQHFLKCGTLMFWEGEPIHFEQ